MTPSENNLISENESDRRENSDELEDDQLEAPMQPVEGVNNQPSHSDNNGHGDASNQPRDSQKPVLTMKYVSSVIQNVLNGRPVISRQKQNYNVAVGNIFSSDFLALPGTSGRSVRRVEASGSNTGNSFEVPTTSRLCPRRISANDNSNSDRNNENIRELNLKLQSLLQPPFPRILSSANSVDNNFFPLRPGKSNSSAVPCVVSKNLEVAQSTVSHINVLDLPEVVLHNIFQLFDYKTISKLRMVNKSFNERCENILNNAFKQIRQQVGDEYKLYKSKVPRRLSARRISPYYARFDILFTVHSRLNLLNLTFGTRISHNHCCFFPGEILDEVRRVLSSVDRIPVRFPNIFYDGLGFSSFQITQELSELCSMAEDYFRTEIEPHLPNIKKINDQQIISENENKNFHQCEESSGKCRVNFTSSAELLHLKKEMKRYGRLISKMHCMLNKYKKQIVVQKKKLQEFSDSYNKKNKETNHRMRLVLRELNKHKMELQLLQTKSNFNGKSKLQRKRFQQRTVYNNKIARICISNNTNSNHAEKILPGKMKTNDHIICSTPPVLKSLPNANCDQKGIEVNSQKLNYENASLSINNPVSEEKDNSNVKMLPTKVIRKRKRRC